MKKFIILLLFPVFLYGQQDFRTVLPNAKAFFRSQEPFNVYEYGTRNYYRGIKITDTIIESGLIKYKFFHEYNFDNYSTDLLWGECLNMEAQCWLGPEVVVYEDGKNVFFNRNYDSIFIETQAGLNSSWIFYISDSGEVYNATVTDISQKEFLDTTDIVKTITVAGEGNTYTLEISKHFGFVKTVNFRDFPGFEGNTWYVFEHDLKGITNPALGYQPLTTGDVFDYEIGDIIHIHTSSVGYYSGGIIYEVIGKEFVNPDTVNYKMIKTDWWSAGPGSSGYSYDTVDFKVENISYVDTCMPFEAHGGQPTRYMLDNNDYNGRIRKTGGDNYFWNPDSCFVLSFEFDIENSEVIKGVGRNYVLDMLPQYFWSETIVYFKKGEETWGTPLVPPSTSVNESKAQIPVNVFPVPAKDFVFIDLITSNYDDAVVTVFDITGKTIFKDKIIDGKLKINTSGWFEGLYFYRISSKGRITTGKFLVRE